MTIGIDDLLKQVQLEERLYRHRCVEAWSMAVPWTGFPLKKIVDIAKPLSSAKYLHMTTFKDASMAPGQKRSFFYPWPYLEGLTMAEANNELAFIVTGMYGKPMPKQDGAPMRLVTPWKYGFKSVKSIVKFTFTDKRPVTFWAKVRPERIRLLGERESGRCRIRAGARRPSACSARMSACRPRSGTAMASSSPRCTTVSRAEKLFV